MDEGRAGEARGPGSGRPGEAGRLERHLAAAPRRSLCPAPHPRLKIQVSPQQQERRCHDQGTNEHRTESEKRGSEPAPRWGAVGRVGRHLRGQPRPLPSHAHFPATPASWSDAPLPFLRHTSRAESLRPKKPFSDRKERLVGSHFERPFILGLTCLTHSLFSFPYFFSIRFNAFLLLPISF